MTYQAGYSKGYNWGSLNRSATRSLLADAGGATCSSEQGETMALIEAKDAAGARVGNSSTTVVDSNGYALVTVLMPCRQNDISIAPKNTDDTIELESTSQMIAPRYGATARVQYATTTVRPVLLRVTRADGKNLPMGAEVEDRALKPLQVHSHYCRPR